MSVRGGGGGAALPSPLVRRSVAGSVLSNSAGSRAPQLPDFEFALGPAKAKALKALEGGPLASPALARFADGALCDRLLRPLLLLFTARFQREALQRAQERTRAAYADGACAGPHSSARRVHPECAPRRDDGWWPAPERSCKQSGAPQRSCVQLGALRLSQAPGWPERCALRTHACALHDPGFPSPPTHLHDPPSLQRARDRRAAAGPGRRGGGAARCAQPAVRRAHPGTQQRVQAAARQVRRRARRRQVRSTASVLCKARPHSGLQPQLNNVSNTPPPRYAPARPQALF